MPTTLRPARLNTKLVVEHESKESRTAFTLACAAVLLLTVAAILALPMALDANTIDPTWLMGP